MNLPQSIKDKIESLLTQDRLQHLMHRLGAHHSGEKLARQFILEAMQEAANLAYNSPQPGYSLEQVEKMQESFGEYLCKELNQAWAIGRLPEALKEWSQTKEGKALLSESDPWISVDSGKFPKDGEVVLVFCPSRGILLQAWNVEQFVLKPSLAWGRDDPQSRITHWQPLPQPPQSKINP